MLIKKERLLLYPPDKVWKALTETSAISTWLMKTDFVAETGRSFYFLRRDQIEITGEILEVDPHRKLVYSWNKEGWPAPTTVTWLLHETQGNTLLVLEHDGFTDAIIDPFHEHNQGWEVVLTKLENFLKD